MAMRRIISYNPKLKGFARNLPNNSTLSEVLLGRKLKRKQMGGYDFHRQKPIDNYIVDFFCSELMLAIEINRRSHEYKVLGDRERQNRMESLVSIFFGLRILK
jgi:very-short-patch-repair endonuclease